MSSKKKMKSSSAGMQSQKKSRSSKLSMQAAKKRKSFKPVNAVVHGINSTNSFHRALVKALEIYGHVSPKKLVYFKNKGKVHLLQFR